MTTTNLQMQVAPPQWSTGSPGWHPDRKEENEETGREIMQRGCDGPKMSQMKRQENEKDRTNSEFPRIQLLKVRSLK